MFNTQGDLGLRNLAGIQLGSTTVSGKLVLSSDTGAISQTGAFNVGADGSSFTASSAGQAVTLSSANVFNGKTIAIHSGADASITADALKFASSTIAGKLIATATSGSITQTGALSLGADGNSFSTSGASQAITLNAANLFGSNTVAFNSSADTSITADTLKFATSSIAGKLVATATSGSITQTGALTLGADGNSFTTSGTSQAITLNAANTFGSNTVALNSSADASITADTLKFAASTISGKLVATASTGSISQTGALNLGADGNSFSTAAGQAITLGSANVLNNKTVALNSGGDATISADALEFAASTVSGKLVATSNSGSITQTGVLNLGADGNSFSSAQAITLGSANVLNGKTVALTSSADASISADALKFATSSIGGKLVATASTGSITQTGALNLGADGNSFSTAAGQAITLNSANVFNGKTVALSSGADASITADALKFAASTVNGKLLATSSSGDISQTGALNLGADGSVFQSAQGVTLASANLFNGKTVALISGSDASITADALKFASSTIGGKLVATTSAGAITQTGGLNLGADGNSFTSSAGQAISLTGANVLNGKTVAIHSGAGASISADALKFAASTVSGDFTATATSGAISQSGALSIAGTSHLNAGSNAINLTQANDFQGLVHLAGGDSQVRDINNLAIATAQVANLTLNSQGALNLGTTTASQLTATSQGGAITQTGVLTVAGDSSLDAGSGTIVLTQANALAGRVSLTGGSAELNNQQALSLGNLSVGALGVSSQGPLNLGSGQAGSLVANSHGGAITQSGALQIAGSSQLNAGAADITLDQAGNDFQSTLSLTGGRVQLRDQNALSLGALQTGALTLRSQGALLLGAGDLASLDARSEGGAITQSGVLRVLGDASLNAGSGALQLSQANEWRGAVRVDAAAVNLNSATALNLRLASGGAAVLRTAGDLQLSGQSQSLDAASAGAITLGTTQVDQQLLLSSQQGLRQLAGSALQVGGGSQILAAGQTVDLRGTQGGPSNRFGGEIDIQAASLHLRAQGPLRAALQTSGGADLDGLNDAVQLRGHVGGDLISHSAAATTIAGLQVDGGAQITAGTSLSQSAALHVAGASRISSGTGSLNLEQADNQFGATVQLQAGGTARLRAASALDVVINSGPGDSRVESLGNQLTVTGQTAGALQLESAGSLSLGALQTAAGLQARAEQGVSQNAALNLGASSRIESRRAALLLDHADNRFQGTLQLQSGGSLDLNSAGDLDLNLVSGQGARINSQGSLRVSGQSAGALRSRSTATTAFAGLQVADSLDSEASAFSQSGALIVGRDAQLRATAGGARLDQAGNRFGGALSLSASGRASLSSSQDLVLTLQTEEQASIQLGQGQLTLSAQARKGLSVESGGGVQLAASQVDGVLSIQAQGPVTQNAALRSQGLLLTGPGAVQLTHADNQIGSLAVRSAGVAEGAIAVRSASALRVATLQGVSGETVAGIQRQGDVSLQTGSAGLSLEAGIATGSNTLRLESSGAVSQNEAATIQAARLALLGAGSFQLQSAGNRIDAVAMSGTPAGAGLSAARDGSVSLRTAGALQVDTVQSLQGIQRQGDVSLRSDSGALRLNQAVQAQGSLLVLQAVGNVSQASGATVQATGLELRGAGAVQLDQAGNRVERLAALGGGGAAGSDGALRFLNSGALELGTVLSSGVQRQGDVSLRSASGDLLLSQPIQLGGATLRLDSAQGRIQQSGGRIEAGSLGLRAAEGIALGQDNAWSGRVAARSERGDLLLRNSQGYTVAELAGDGDLFAGTRGLAAPAAGAAVVLNTGSGLVQQAAGAGILAEGLELQGAAAYSLKDASNQVQRFAAVQGGANDGAIDYVDQDGFEVSSVKASGIQRSGRVQLSNPAGQLTLEPQAASLVSLQGGTVSVASPQLVDGQLSLPVFTLSGTIALDKGLLSLKALQGAKVDAERLGRYQAELGLAKEVILVDAAGRPVKILADVFVQNSGAIRVAEGAQLHLQAEQGASASLLQTGNDFSGGFSASLGKANAAGSTEDRGPRSLLQLAGQTIQLKNEGVAADLLHFTADRMSTVDQAQITARMSFNNTLGTLTQMPALVFNFGSQAATPSNPNPFGVQPSGSLKVQVGTDGLAAQGGAEAGYVSLRPNTRLDPTRTQSLIANRAAIYLSGRETGVAGYLFFYDGAGVQTEIPIYYNGYAPSSPQVEGALSSIASVSESARRDRFEEAVRTENVASRLRGGVITEVGPGSPATKGSSGAASPAGCNVAGGDGSSGQSPLSCAAGS
ncbi:beta strand repeat-containing protein [Paucibacter sp. B51]|uniref:beta strand repeat-containing protein n=1 Tax=Paucibacter sp. B51 TaxID=2993315 RepID=UPI0022EC0569|nr:hypothetical protein [Paucibacter sp. B51]